MVFQNPDNQIVSNVVEEDVAFAPENLGVPTQEIAERVDAALEACRRGGLSQKACAACRFTFVAARSSALRLRGVLLAMRPRAIVLTRGVRPTAMLDPHRDGGGGCLDASKSSAVSRISITVDVDAHHMDEAHLRRPRDCDG
ncbi:MAG: hypothetical protein ACLS3C_11030 [Oscillospiraceae bacterium]